MTMEGVPAPSPMSTEARRALATRIKTAPTRAERVAAGRALIANRERTIRICMLCGAPFETYAKGQVGRFCSRAHHRRAYYLEHGERLRARERERKASQRRVLGEKPCGRCGNAFLPRNAQQKYCRPSCRQLAYVERNRPRVRALRRGYEERRRQRAKT
jgi:hypothetical protein